MMGDNKSEKFFKVLDDRMKEAQTDIKATVSVNVNEMTHKANEKELEHGERRQTLPDTSPSGVTGSGDGSTVLLVAGTRAPKNMTCSSPQLSVCEGGSSTLVLPGSGGHPLLVQGQSITSALPVQPAAEQQEVEMEMGPAVTIMKPILRFLQLLCENHNQDLQVS